MAKLGWLYDIVLIHIIVSQLNVKCTKEIGFSIPSHLISIDQCIFQFSLHTEKIKIRVFPPVFL